MIQQLKRLLEKRVNQCVNDKEKICSKIERKKASLFQRNAVIPRQPKITEKSIKKTKRKYYIMFISNI